MKNYIKNQQTKLKRKRVGNIDVFIKDEIPNFNSVSVIEKVTDLVPNHLLNYIDTIYIGEFEHLKNRSLDASYSNGMIFINNKQQSENDMLDDLVHEIAHSVEEVYTEQIYSDLTLQREFLIKREKLYNLLGSEGFEVENYSFDNVNYDIEFDRFLYKDVTYAVLRSITSDIFYSPYGATSLREYFANGFEAVFYHKDIKKLSNISPILLEKIEELL